MKSLPFDKPGHWFRGNLHTHSTASDGSKTPAEVCSVYRRRGYSFISLTDHFQEKHGFPITDTRPYRKDGFTTILGAELHAPKTSLGDPWHILAVGLPADFTPTGRRETGPHLASRAVKAGAYVAAAHPAWYDLADRDVLSLRGAKAIEVFNSTCNAYNGKGNSIGYLDRLISQGHHYHAIATDDAHFSPVRPDHCQNWVVVRSRTLAPEPLLAALHAGHFYSSQGPEILGMKVNWRSKKLSIRTTPVRSVVVTGRGSKAGVLNADREITKAELDISHVRGGYARVTLADKRGRKAWTNPFWF
ncbi:MAG: phosphotransferase [Phycisphaeraceae bacterium]|nr:phosphotransferase [Phycisphaeraceae bacterium]|tara:strand:+ start:269 stop:1177 length:909 start_codon:yes stop_codon:yes gene_type:complete